MTTYNWTGNGKDDKLSDQNNWIPDAGLKGPSTNDPLVFTSTATVDCIGNTATIDTNSSLTLVNLAGGEITTSGTAPVALTISTPSNAAPTLKLDLNSGGVVTDTISGFTEQDIEIEGTAGWSIKLNGGTIDSFNMDSLATIGNNDTLDLNTYLRGVLYVDDGGVLIMESTSESTDVYVRAGGSLIITNASAYNGVINFEQGTVEVEGLNASSWSLVNQTGSVTIEFFNSSSAVVGELELADNGNATPDFSITHQGSNFFILSGSTTPTPPPPSPPTSGTLTVSGINATQTVAAGGTITPFGGLKVSDTGSSASDTAQIMILDANAKPTDSLGNFSNSGTILSKGSAGTYTLSGQSPETLTSTLDALTFNDTGTVAATGTIVVNVTNAADGQTQSASIALSETASGNQPPAPPTPPSPPAPPPTGNQNNFLVQDETTGQSFYMPGTAYPAGGVPGLTQEIIYPTTDQVNISSEIPNVFINLGGSGQSPTVGGINVSAGNGNNVLNSYANSSYLTDGSGVDQNYMDVRALTQNQWDTVVNFHSGDNVTMWGVTPSDFTLNWIGDSEGAPGHTGLTGVLVPTSGSGYDIGITLAGYTMADVNTKLAITYSQTTGPTGAPYLSIHAV